jgi:transposase InsO family protein
MPGIECSKASGETKALEATAAQESLILTDRGTEYCGSIEHHEYQLYLAIEDVDHTRTKARSPQTNGICDRFHRTILNEFYQVAFRKKIYQSCEQLQHDVDEWVEYYNWSVHIQDNIAMAKR